MTLRDTFRHRDMMENSAAYAARFAAYQATERRLAARREERCLKKQAQIDRYRDDILF